jgi:hypothetical protein
MPRGGPRPGSGAPKGNLNALKHGRTSRRQAQLIEAFTQLPEARESLIAMSNRNRQRRKQAEEGVGVFLTVLLEQAAALALDQVCDRCGAPVNQGQNNQRFLDFLNATTGQMRVILKKQPERRRISTKGPRTPDPGKREP